MPTASNMTFDFDFLLSYTSYFIHRDLSLHIDSITMSTEPTENKAIPTNGSEEPHGAEEQEAGDHPRVKKKRLGVDPSLIISDGRSKRRKTPTPTPETDVKKEDGAGDRDPKDTERANTLGREIYQKILGLTDKE